LEHGPLNMSALLRYAIVVLAVLAASGAFPAMGRDAGTLVLGRVSNNAERDTRLLQPIADYAAKAMADVGVTGARVRIYPDNAAMILALRNRDVDWITETASSALVFMDKADAKILLRRWKRGVSEYQTFVLARRDSGIASLDDLVGRTIAFEDKGSTSAFFIPAYALIERGLRLVRLASPGDRPPMGAVGYVFSGEELISSAWVHRGRVSASALSNLDWNKPDSMPPAFKQDLRIIYASPKFPYALELVRSGLDPAIRTRLKQILLRAHKDPKARTALKAYQGTTKFDAFPAESRTVLEDLRELQKVVASIMP
jgi:phosphonate transport system substrate-binding protein